MRRAGVSAGRRKAPAYRGRRRRDSTKVARSKKNPPAIEAFNGGRRHRRNAGPPGTRSICHVPAYVWNVPGMSRDRRVIEASSADEFSSRTTRKVLGAADAEARGFPEHAFASQDRTAVIPGGTGGTGGTAANSANFWWYRTVGPVGPPWKIADPRGQPWAHWSHLSVPPVRANSCGVPKIRDEKLEDAAALAGKGFSAHCGQCNGG
jgi:hypothetical protein